MAAVTIHSDFGAQENKVCHCFHCFPIYSPRSALFINLFHMDSFPTMWIIPYYGEIHRKRECCVTLWSKWGEIWGPHILVWSAIMVRWHHWLNGHDFEQTPGDGEGQGSLVCCGPRGRKELDRTERLNNINNNRGGDQRYWSTLCKAQDDPQNRVLWSPMLTVCWEEEPVLEIIALSSGQVLWETFKGDFEKRREKDWSLKKLKGKVLLLLLSHFSRVRHCATPWTAAHQAPPSMGFSRQQYWSGVPLPSPKERYRGPLSPLWL